MDEAASTADGLGSINLYGDPGAQPLPESSLPTAATAGVKIA